MRNLLPARRGGRYSHVDQDPLLAQQIGHRSTSLQIRRHPPHIEHGADYDIHIKIPEDLLIQILSCLSGDDKCNAAFVCKSWKVVVYQPILWPKLNLSSYSHSVHDLLVEHILTKTEGRFSELYEISLEGCSALTHRTLGYIADNCHDLRVLLLTGCANIHPRFILPYVRRLRHLQKLELIGVTDDTSIAPQIKECRPWIDLGMFWLQYLADTGKSDVLLVTVGQNGSRYKTIDELEEEKKRQADEDGVRQRSGSNVDLDDPDIELAPDSTEMEPLIDSFQVDDILMSTFHRQKHPHRSLLDDRALSESDDGLFQERHRERFVTWAMPDYQSPLKALENHFCEADESGFAFPPDLEDARCQFGGRFVGGCWGDVRGRVVYSNVHYDLGGNYPDEVLFSCEFHSNEDEKNVDLIKCQECEKLFREDSICEGIVCKVCSDNIKLAKKEIWIELTDKGIKKFNFGHVCSNTLKIADRRNLPRTLKPLGTVPGRVSYEPAFEEEQIEDPSRVPIRAFWDQNERGVSHTVRQITEKLKEGQKEMNTRALLVFDENDDIEILADEGLLFDGEEGRAYINLTINAWGEFYNVTVPVFFMVAATIFFISQIMYFTRVHPAIQVPQTTLVRHEPQSNASSTTYLIWALIAFVVLIVCACLAYHCQRQCEQIFRAFLVVDIFLILTIGASIFTYVTSRNFLIDVDTVTYVLGVLNFSTLGLVAFYKPVPPMMQRVFLILLNADMSIMITTVISWYVGFLIGLVALADLAAMLRPRIFGRIPPFLLPANLQIPNQTPRIFYEANGLKLRASDFMFYGLMVGLTSQMLEFTQLTILMLSVLCMYVICVFVLPFNSMKVRPLPLVFIAVLVLLFLNEQIFGEYMASTKWILVFP